MKKQHEEELREMQDQLKKLLDQKVAQIQDDADDQIGKIKKQEREVQSQLEEKVMEIERDYIRLDHHEKVVEEKNSLLQKLKEDLSRKDLDHRQEVSSKLKNLEERLTQEYEAKLKAIKGIFF